MAKSEKLKKVFGIRKHTVHEVPSVPLRAQIKIHDWHVQLAFPNGYVSLTASVYGSGIGAAGRQALKGAIYAVPLAERVTSMNGSMSEYVPLVVTANKKAGTVTLTIGDGGPVVPAYLAVDPTVELKASYKADTDTDADPSDDPDEDADEPDDPDDD